jgi:hypothetical protein
MYQMRTFPFPEEARRGPVAFSPGRETGIPALQVPPPLDVET